MGGRRSEQRRRLTWVSYILLPLRVGNDLVFIHHLHVLVLYLIAVGREKPEGAFRLQMACLCHPSPLGLAEGAIGGEGRSQGRLGAGVGGGT